MRHMSNDARKVYIHLETRGIQFDPLDVFLLERALGSFYPNHIISVIDQILRVSSNAPMRAAEQGFDYFAYPIRNMLTKRAQAQRSTPYAQDHSIDFPEWDHLSNWLIADYNTQEAIIIFDTWWSYTDAQIAAGMRAAKEQQKRSVYYLNGVLKRDAADRAGRVAEVKRHEEEAAEHGWDPGTFEKMDAGERAAVQIDWVAQQEHARFIKAMENLL